MSMNIQCCDDRDTKGMKKKRNRCSSTACGGLTKLNVLRFIPRIIFICRKINTRPSRLVFFLLSRLPRSLYTSSRSQVREQREGEKQEKLGPSPVHPHGRDISIQQRRRELCIMISPRFTTTTARWQPRAHPRPSNNITCCAS
uniref:Uncharacterized protein n=1 Tax=Trichogramma kaykai TaxID=54128 RepID=A0ABD2XPD6_9HYME